MAWLEEKAGLISAGAPAKVVFPAFSAALFRCAILRKSLKVPQQLSM
jgi:hypothetical protein